MPPAGSITRWICHRRSNVDRICRLASHEQTPAFRRPGRLNCLLKSFGHISPATTASKQRAARSVRRSMTAQRPPGRILSESRTAGKLSPDWFAAPDTQKPQIDAYSWGRPRTLFELASEEPAPHGEDAILMDKEFDCQSPRAEDATPARMLNRISCNNVDVKPARVVYTAWANEAGGVRGRSHRHPACARRGFMVVAANPRSTAP